MLQHTRGGNIPVIDSGCVHNIEAGPSKTSENAIQHPELTSQPGGLQEHGTPDKDMPSHSGVPNASENSVTTGLGVHCQPEQHIHHCRQFVP
jgi:hypothetical protein